MGSGKRIVDITVLNSEGEMNKVLRGDNYCCCKTDECSPTVESLVCYSVCDISLTALPEGCQEPGSSCKLDVLTWKSPTELNDDGNVFNQSFSIRCRAQEKTNKVL